MDNCLQVDAKRKEEKGAEEAARLGVEQTTTTLMDKAQVYFVYPPEYHKSKTDCDHTHSQGPVIVKMKKCARARPGKTDCHQKERINMIN